MQQCAIATVLKPLTDCPVIRGKLLNAEQLLNELFEPTCRPSLRWLRNQTRTKSIPFFRLGRLVFFEADLVRASLAGKHLIRNRASSLNGRGKGGLDAE
jgi:hypothetical protein